MLHGTTSYTFVYDHQRQSTQTTAAVVKVEPTIKTEDFTALLDVMKQSLRLVTKVIRVSLHLFAISIATFVEAVILKIAVMFSRSISVTVSVYFTMMGALPFQAEFQEQLLAKHSRITLTNCLDKILTPHPHI